MFVLHIELKVKPELQQALKKPISGSSAQLSPPRKASTRYSYCIRKKTTQITASASPSINRDRSKNG